MRSSTVDIFQETNFEFVTSLEEKPIMFRVNAYLKFPPRFLTTAFDYNLDVDTRAEICIYLIV